MKEKSQSVRSILFVCDFPFAGAGGVGRVSEVLAAEFLCRGIKVAYLAFCGGRKSTACGVTQYFIPEPQKLNYKKNIQYTRGLIEELQIDIIINQAGAKSKVLNLLVKASLNTPVFSVHHNCVKCLHANYQNIITENFKKKKYFKLLDNSLGWALLNRYHLLKHGYLFKKAIEVSGRLVLLSQVFVGEMKAYVPDFPEGKVVGIPNPVSFAVADGVEEKKENRLVFVGRVVYQQKRVDLLLDIWGKIYSEFPDWHFDIVGDGADREGVEEKAKAQNLERIHFLGYQDPRPFLEKAKIFCMTSSFEGFPMVLVEAQAYGVVPFAFNSFSSLSDIIQSGCNGFIFPESGIEQYVGKLKALMVNEELRKEMAKNGQAGVSKYDPATICDQWMTIINETIQNR